MILCNALPRASIQERKLSWDEVQQVFFNGEGLDINRSNAESLSPIAGAHRILSNGFGLIPFGCYVKNGDARDPVNDQALDYVLKTRPNPMMTPFMVHKLVMSNAFWWGFGAVWNVRDNSGRIVERWPLPTECCSIKRDPNTGQYWYTYSVDGEQKTFSPYELSFLYFETYDGMRGRGMMDLAKESIAADGMAQRHNKKFYQNGARIGGIVEVDTDADKDSREKVRSEFQKFASGDAFKVAVLDHGMKYTQLGLNMVDAQYIESRNFTVEEISRFTGIPKWMLQHGKESYNSNAQQRVAYVTDTLLPYVTQWEQENTYKMLPKQRLAENWYIRGNTSVLLRGDDKTRAEVYEAMIRSAMMSPDEGRALEERGPIPGGWGKRFLVTKNLGSLERVLEGDD